MVQHNGIRDGNRLVQHASRSGHYRFIEQPEIGKEYRRDVAAGTEIIRIEDGKAMGTTKYQFPGGCTAVGPDGKLIATDAIFGIIRFHGARLGIKSAYAIIGAQP